MINEKELRVGTIIKLTSAGIVGFNYWKIYSKLNNGESKIYYLSLHRRIKDAIIETEPTEEYFDYVSGPLPFSSINLKSASIHSQPQNIIEIHNRFSKIME